MCARLRSTSRTSLAESLLPICASVHSRHSIRNSLPGLTVAAAGMSGCQRLWPGTACSAIGLDWSTEKTTSGMAVPPLSSASSSFRTSSMYFRSTALSPLPAKWPQTPGMTRHSPLGMCCEAHCSSSGGK